MTHPVILSAKRAYSPNAENLVLRGYNYRGLKSLFEGIGGSLTAYMPSGSAQLVYRVRLPEFTLKSTALKMPEMVDFVFTLQAAFEILRDELTLRGNPGGEEA